MNEDKVNMSKEEVIEHLREVAEESRKRIKTLKAENGELQGQIFKYTDINWNEKEGVHAMGQGSFVRVMANGFIKMFKDEGAINVLEIKMFHPEAGHFFMTIQREDGKTPMDLKIEVEAKLDRYQKLIEAVVDTGDRCYRLESDIPTSCLDGFEDKPDCWCALCIVKDFLKDTNQDKS